MHRTSTRTTAILQGAILALVVIGLALAVGGCTDSDGTAASSTSSPAPTTTTGRAPDTSTTTPSDGLDLSGSRWVTHGLDGIRLSDGTSVWETEPFPTGVARDGEGGIVFTDATGLWWFRSGETDPRLVNELAAELITVVDTPSGPAAVTWDAGLALFSLEDGEPIEAPSDLGVEVSSDGAWSQRWTAANGLAALVKQPEVERDAEGQPSEILEPARLVIAQGEETLVDLPIGSADEPWVTLHDFDGQRLIISRGPFEPAMPEETFLVIDLARGAVTESFTAGGTRATLTGPDVDWSGPVQTPDLDG